VAAYTDRKLSARYPTDLDAWQELKSHYRDSMRNRHLRDLFSQDRKRTERYTLEAGELVLDYSKSHLNTTTHKLLVKLAKEAGVPEAVQQNRALTYLGRVIQAQATSLAFQDAALLIAAVFVVTVLPALLLAKAKTTA